ncbi:MAG: hypothetical protein HZA79_15690 [Sphingobacteriales bacterium]|nr:hypothetical protein [Sphingobacteriales bacterium]
MKQRTNLTALKKIFPHLLISSALFLALLSPGMLSAQTDSTTAKQPAAEEESGLIAPGLEFTSVQKADNSVGLKAILKAKVKGSFIKLPLLKVAFVLVSDTAEKELGFAITDRNGAAVLNVPADAIAADKDGNLHVKALFKGNKSMEPAEEELTVKRARLVITPVKEDSLLTVQVKLVDLSTGAETPVPETAIGIFVQRSFNPLKLGEGTTDEAGEATVEIPGKLPGDPKGNITLLARLDENETYGNLEAAVTQPWGVAVSDKDQQLPRALWSTHPPIWMLVTFIILMTVVWGHYIVIIYELFRLRKEEPHESTNATI